MDASATRCLVGLGKAKYVDMQNLWIQEASKSGLFTRRKVDTNVNPADLITKPLVKPRIEQPMGGMTWAHGRVDRQESDDVFATWEPQKSGTLVASSVLRDSSSDDDVVLVSGQN